MTKVSGPLDQPPTPLVSKTQCILADKPEVTASYTSQEVTTSLTSPETRSLRVHIYPRPITLAKRYLRFYRCHMGLTCFIKLIRFFILNICLLFLYVIPLQLMLDSIPEFTALILDFQNGNRPPSWILKFLQICQKFKFEPTSTSTCTGRG